VAGALKDFRGAVVLNDIDGNVVNLYRVGHGDQPAVLDMHLVRLVVVAPVADVFDALLGQSVRGIKSLRQAGAHPAARCFAGEFLNGLDGAADDGAFVRFGINSPLDKTVSHHLPAGGKTVLDKLRVAQANRGIEADGGANAMAVQYLFQPPEPYAQA